MNTRLGKSFGLAFVVAVGILAVMFALGTFNAQKAGATHVDGDVLSSQDAGAGVSLTIAFTPGAIITAGDDVVIELKNFQIASPIDADAISIKGTTTANAADVSVSGSKITVEIPDMDGDAATGAGDNLPVALTTIRIRSRAGVMNPTLAGDTYMVKVTHEQGILYEHSPGFILATLKVDPKSGLEGEEVTVSGVGYSNGTATIYHTGGAAPPAAGSLMSAPPGFTRVGSAPVSDGSFSTSVTAGDDFTAAGNNLVARSSTGQWGPPAVFTVNGAISIPESVTKGTDLTIKVSKWSAGPITRATINGANMYTVGSDGVDDGFMTQTPDSDGAKEFKIRVGDGALLGEQTLVLYATEAGEAEKSAGQKNIDIVGIDLTVSPSTAVVGQEVTVTGSGFVNGKEIISLSIGGVSVLSQIAATDRGVASGGRVVAAFIVPANAKLADADDYTISLGDGTRTGSAMVTIPERTLTVSPAESRIGSRIDLSGTGWPIGTGPNLVGIYYGDNQLSSATTDSSGEWSATITVPGHRRCWADQHGGGQGECGCGRQCDHERGPRHSRPGGQCLTGAGATWGHRHRFR